MTSATQTIDKWLLSFIGKLAIVPILMSLLACTSSGPATSYYALSPSASSAAPIDATQRSIGVGPVKLAGYLQNTAIVSRGEGQRLNISGYHAWAEPLDDAIVRVLSADLAHSLKQKNIWPFPWDMRNRPDLQLKISVDQFDGVRGSEVKLNVQWTLFKLDDGSVLAVGREQLGVQADGASYSAYVAAMNQLLVSLTAALADQLQSY